MNMQIQGKIHAAFEEAIGTGPIGTGQPVLVDLSAMTYEWGDALGCLFLHAAQPELQHDQGRQETPECLHEAASISRPTNLASAGSVGLVGPVGPVGIVGLVGIVGSKMPTSLTRSARTETTI